MARVSKCVEGVLWAQLKSCEARRGKAVTSDEVAYAFDAFKMQHGVFEESDYACENLINDRIGIYPSTIMSVYENNTIDIYCGTTINEQNGADSTKPIDPTLEEESKDAV